MEVRILHRQPMAKELDTYKEATPIIPALTRGWRIGCALRGLLFASVLTIGLAYWYASSHNLIIYYGNPFYDLLGTLDRHPLLFLIPEALSILFAYLAYFSLSIWLYRWWYSRGG